MTTTATTPTRIYPSSVLSLALRHHPEFTMPIPASLRKNFDELKVVYWNDRGDGELEQSLLDPIVFGDVSHSGLYYRVKHMLINSCTPRWTKEPTLSHRFPVVMKGAVVETTYYLTWIDKLVLLVCVCFCSDLFSLPPDPISLHFPENLRSFLWSHHFSSVLSRPLFMERWAPKLVDQNTIWSFCLDYSSQAGEKQKASYVPHPREPELEAKVFRVVMFNEILSQSGVSRHMSERLGLLRYMLMRKQYDATADGADPEMQQKARRLQTQKQSVDRYMETGKKDYSNWLKGKAEDNYAQSVEAVLDLVQSANLTAPCPARAPILKHRVQWLSTSTLLEILTQNKELYLLDLLTGMHPDLSFGFVEKQFSLGFQERLYQHARVLGLPVGDIDHFDVWNPASNRVEVLLQVPTYFINAITLFMCGQQGDVVDWTSMFSASVGGRFDKWQELYPAISILNTMFGARMTQEAITAHAKFASNLFRLMRQRSSGVSITNQQLLTWLLGPFCACALTEAHQRVMDALDGSVDRFRHTDSGISRGAAVDFYSTHHESVKPAVIQAGSAPINTLCLWSLLQRRVVPLLNKWMDVHLKGAPLDEQTLLVLDMILALPQLYVPAPLFHLFSTETKLAPCQTAQDFMFQLLGGSGPCTYTVPSEIYLPIWQSSQQRVLNPICEELCKDMDAVTMHQASKDKSNKRPLEYIPEFDLDQEPEESGSNKRVQLYSP
jgi:hypothetical protein